MRYLKKLLFPIGLPLFLAFVLSDKTFLNFLGMLIGSSFIWIPCLLAWWLSDGFTNMFERGNASPLEDQVFRDYPKVSTGIDPYTGRVCMTIEDMGGKIHIPTNTSPREIN